MTDNPFQNPFETASNPFTDNNDTTSIENNDGNISPVNLDDDTNPFDWGIPSIWDEETEVNQWWSVFDSWSELQWWDAREILEEYNSWNKDIDKLVNKIASKFVFRKVNLKPWNKIKIEDIGDLWDYKRGKINIKITNLSTTYSFDPTSVTWDDDFYKAVDGAKKYLSKLTTEIWKEKWINEEHIKYVLPVTEWELTVVNTKSVDKKKLWRIWKEHDNTYNIYVWDVITGKKEKKLEEIHKWSNEVVVEVADMAKNIGIWWQQGSWKSVLIRWLINSAMAKSANMFNFLVLEKETDFLNYFKFKNMLFNDAVWNMNIEKIYSLFVYLALQYKKRNLLFNQKGVAHLRAYNKLVPESKRLPLLILLVDEYKELRDTLKKQSVWKMDLDKNFWESLGWLLQVSRASWILAWVATQQATDERWVHLWVKNNLSAWFIWTTIEGKQFGWLTTLQRKNVATINKWDFYTLWTIGKNFIRCPYWDADHIDDEEFYTRMPLKKDWQNFRDASYIRDYSNNYIIETIEKIVDELGMDLFQVNTKLYQMYHVDINWINNLRGLRKIAIIVFINQFLKWFETAINMVTETTNIPENFNLVSITTSLRANSEYKPFWLLFDYMIYIYELNYAKFVENNFNFKSKKKIIEEGSEEEKEQLRAFFTQKVMDMMDYKLKEVNFWD